MSWFHRRHRFRTAVLGVLLCTAACVLPVDFWDEHTMTVHTTAGKAAEVSASQTVDLSQSTDVTAYLKAVTLVQIPVVELRIANVQADNRATRMSGSIAIADPSDSSWAPVTLSYSNASITEGGTIQLVPTPADVARLSAMLLVKKRFEEEDSASFDSQPAHFDFTSRIHIVAQVDSSKL